MLEKVATTYNDTSFCDRYISLCSQHSHDNMMSNARKDDVLEVFKSLGYNKVKYKSKGDYFEIENYEVNEIHPGVYAGINVTTKYGVVIFIISIVINEDNENGGPYDAVCEKLGCTEIPKPPRFENLEELKEILADGLVIYEDIKDGLKSSAI
jgi:hypothetical protein